MAVMTKAKERYLGRMTLVAGTTAATNIAIAGIKTTDTIVWCIESATAAAISTRTDRTSECSITSDGYIQLASTNSSSNQLEVHWLQNSV